MAAPRRGDECYPSRVGRDRRRGWIAVALVVLLLATGGCLLHLHLTFGGRDNGVFG